MMAVASASKTTSSCNAGCFAFAADRRRLLSSARCAVPASVAAAVVPPPGSRLHHWRLNKLSSANGTKRRTSSESPTDFTYAHRSSCVRPESTIENDVGMQESRRDRHESHAHDEHDSRDASSNRRGVRFRMPKPGFSRHPRAPSKLASESDADLDYERRKAAWAAKYTSVATLRNTFGTNKNKFWGDFDPVTTRKLYHTLLPRALLGLHDMGLSKVDELAPLAYQARMAAKKYARERSRLPGRIGSMVYDGFRHWKKYGKFDAGGMSWEQVWRKYEDQVLREAFQEVGAGDGFLDAGASNDPFERADLDDRELTARICLRILERSVTTNEAIDRLFLKRVFDDGQEDDEEECSDDETRVSGTDANLPSFADTSTVSSRIAHDDIVKSVKIARKRERQRRRKLRIRARIQADLRAIEKKFDDDIRELLRHGGGGRVDVGDGDSMVRSRAGGRLRENSGRERSFFWRKSSSSSSVRPRGSSGGDETPSFADVSVTRSKAAFVRGGAEEFDLTALSESEIAAAMFSIDSVLESNTQKEGAPSSSIRRLTVHEVFALRILASTKQRIASLQALSQLDDGGREDGDDFDRNYQ